MADDDLSPEERVRRALDADPDAAHFIAIKGGDVTGVYTGDGKETMRLLGTQILTLSRENGVHPTVVAAQAAQWAVDHADAPMAIEWGDLE